jgi:hypothetical protein
MNIIEIIAVDRKLMVNLSMSFLDRMMGRRPDPTEGWGPFQLPLPDFDPTEKCFGSLKFGDEISAASFLGRPTRVQWSKSDYIELLYAAGGFQVDFDHGRFAYLAFFIRPDERIASKGEIARAEPLLRNNGQNLVRFSESSTTDELKKLFGQPTTADNDEDESVLSFDRNGLTLEFELNTKQRLKRWNVFPTTAAGG